MILQFIVWRKSYKIDDIKNKKLFEKYRELENSEILLFDADNDKDLDFYLASGGVEISRYSELLFDRLFLNDGNGNFSDSNQVMPDINNKISTGAVKASDVDNDGDLDLFIGERIKIGRYGMPGSGFLLINDGNGKFINETNSRAPKFKEIGMITDASFVDLDNDNYKDLVIVGEYMGIKIFKTLMENLNPFQII